MKNQIVRILETLLQPGYFKSIDSLLKSRTSRPPAPALLLERTLFLSLCDLFFQMKSKKNVLICIDIGSLTKGDRVGYTRRDNPPALERRTLPKIDKSLWSQRLKTDLFFLGLSIGDRGDDGLCALPVSLALIHAALTTAVNPCVTYYWSTCPLTDGTTLNS